MFQFFNNLSLRWKLQIEIMAIAMAVTIYNRWTGANQLADLIEIAKQSSLSAAAINKLQQQYYEFLTTAFFDVAVQFVIQFFLVSLIVRIFLTPILELIESLKAAEKGDLTQGVLVRSKDELGELESHFNKMLKQLSAILASVEKSSIHMSQSAFQIAEVSHEIENISKSEEAKSIEVSEATEQLFSSALQIVGYAEETTDKANSTAEKSQQGQQSLATSILRMEKISNEIEQASLQINELVQSTATINNILGGIKDIAEQTNLLALNAAIEAARAGEQGRGFAVVADEVRQLAFRTRQSADEVSGIVATLTSKVHSAENTMGLLVTEINDSQHQINQSASIIDEMQKDVIQTANLNSQISEACNLQMQTFETLKITHQSLFNTLQENSAKIANTANISDLLYNLTNNLKLQMAGLKFTSIESAKDVNPNHEKRIAKRVEGHKLIALTDGKRKWEGLSQDISLKGMRVLLQEQLPKNTHLKLSIRKPHEDMEVYRQQPLLNFEVKVAWQKNLSQEKFIAGLQFLNLTNIQQHNLSEFVGFFDT